MFLTPCNNNRSNLERLLIQDFFYKNASNLKIILGNFSLVFEYYKPCTQVYHSEQIKQTHNSWQILEIPNRICTVYNKSIPGSLHPSLISSFTTANGSFELKPKKSLSISDSKTRFQKQESHLKSKANIHFLQPPKPSFLT